MQMAIVYVLLAKIMMALETLIVYVQMEQLNSSHQMEVTEFVNHLLVSNSMCIH